LIFLRLLSLLMVFGCSSASKIRTASSVYLLMTLRR
jgi:uncharacterized protein YcfL